MSGEEVGRLTVAQRACLLRAARRRLTEMSDEVAGLVMRGAHDSDVKLATEEVQCVQAAIRWLWKDQRADDG